MGALGLDLEEGPGSRTNQNTGTTITLSKKTALSKKFEAHGTCGLYMCSSSLMRDFQDVSSMIAVEMGQNDCASLSSESADIQRADETTD